MGEDILLVTGFGQVGPTLKKMRIEAMKDTLQSAQRVIFRQLLL